MFRNVAFVGALLWLLHRLWQVYQKPVRELVDVLGLDIPPVPDVSLAGISADSVLLYWKPPENPHVSLKHIIQVNGINVGEFSRWDASIQVTGLKPGHYYNIRAIAINTANFSTPGPLIRLRTSLPPVRSVDNASTLDDAQTNSGTSAAGGTEAAGLRAAVSHTESTTLIPSHAMAREHSGSQSHHHNKRVISGRRSSPATNGVEHVAWQSGGVGGADEQDESEETIKQLTEKLDSLRHEYEDTEKQIDEEDEEFETSRTAMVKERDGLKQGGTGQAQQKYSEQEGSKGEGLASETCRETENERRHDKMGRGNYGDAQRHPGNGGREDRCYRREG
ncbi:MAG: hypothetical protein FRX48_00180 [Lasallia pustulata]|uniref:Fibronectin type-III domain-containing protein n=1 Tax=Lasallia pustulata TaxID=136370 RepID=A0A5M8Q2N3_9LECA|nr:MAG: hypothetical protein FRX48_00180 [Lasallia pustulata]